MMVSRFHPGILHSSPIEAFPGIQDFFPMSLPFTPDKDNFIPNYTYWGLVCAYHKIITNLIWFGSDPNRCNGIPAKAIDNQMTINPEKISEKGSEVTTRTERTK